MAKRTATIEGQVLGMLKVKAQKPKEARQVYLARLAKALDSSGDTAWEQMGEPAQKWANTAITACNTGDPIPDFPDADVADTEEAAPAARKRSGKASHTTEEIGGDEADADEADADEADADEADAPPEKPAKGSKKGKAVAKPVKPAKPAKDEAKAKAKAKRPGRPPRPEVNSDNIIKAGLKMLRKHPAEDGKVHPLSCKELDEICDGVGLTPESDRAIVRKALREKSLHPAQGAHEDDRMLSEKVIAKLAAKG